MTTPILKQPGETLRLPLRFDAAVVRVDQLGVAARGLVAGAAALIPVATIGGTLVDLALAGGTDGERYLVTLRVEDADGQLPEREIEVAVVEASWSLRGGARPYLSIADFVEEVGLDEVVAMTDATGTGRIDRVLLTRALAAAQALVDAHLAGRYATPLVQVPPIVALAMVDLARGRLYPRGAPEGVADAARAATKLLERIQSGAMPLAVAGVAAPSDQASATPVLIAPARRQYPDGLAGY